MSGEKPPIALEIHDYTQHMAEGGRKDAFYITGAVDPHVEACRMDLVVFDGARNVQKAAKE